MLLFMLDTFGQTILLALALAVLSHIGYARIASGVVSALSGIFNTQAHAKRRDMWNGLRAARARLAEISAQDEFARWARQRREVDAAQAAWETEDGRTRASRAAKESGLAIVLRIVMWLKAVWWLWAHRKLPALPLPDAVFGPVSRILSFPLPENDFASAPVVFLLACGAVSAILAGL